MSVFSAWMREMDSPYSGCMLPAEWVLLTSDEQYEECCEVAVAALQGRTFYEGTFFVKVVRGLDSGANPVMFLSNGGFQPTVGELSSENARWNRHLNLEGGVRVPPTRPLIQE